MKFNNPMIGRRAAVLFIAIGLPIMAADAPQGVTNFQQVSDHLYRGAQPTSDGFKSLSKLGVKTIVDLRESGSRAREEQKLVESLGMRYVNVPLAGFSAPTEDEVLKVQALFEDGSPGPVFVHCRRGADRTGTMVAIYRINHDHWSNDQALKEAKSFKMAGWEVQMKNYVRHYQARQAQKVEAAQNGQPTVSTAAATQ